PRSNAATRSTRSTGSSDASIPAHPTSACWTRSGMAAEGTNGQTTEADSRARRRHAGPLTAAPSVRLFNGLNQAPRYDDVTGGHRLNFHARHGRPARGTDDYSAGV